jgi:hypothetical protein
MSNLAIDCNSAVTELSGVNGGAVRSPSAFSQLPTTL